MNLLAHLKAMLDAEPGIWTEERVLKRGEFLLRQGEVERHTWYIEEGAVHAVWGGAEDAQTIRFGYAGDFINALDSFLTGAPSQLDLQALRKTVVRGIARESLFRLLEEKPELAALWRQLLEALVVQQMEREYDLLVASPAERFERVMRRSPQLFQEVPHKYIASYLRMTPETLSRIKKS